ncbi:MAG: DUF3291 domain-containing protein [Vampirovibrionales bacterium]|nr:DUF3291 domain-containing protein [Vampirovibrionales bacterium]
MLTTSHYHLAQINISKAIAPLDTPLLKGFVDRLDEINALAEEQPGFVWRLIGEDNNATDITWSDDPLVIINMSVWQTPEHLSRFVYQTKHVELLAQRSQWFKTMNTPHMALWWIPTGHIPSIAEAKERMEHLKIHGPTPFAFTFKDKIPPDNYYRSEESTCI